MEGGLSINEDLIKVNMLEETVVDQRLVFDTICNAGIDVAKGPVTPKMAASVTSASVAYKTFLATKYEQQTEEQQQLKDKRKH